MNTGTALVAPEGFGSMEASEVYYLVANTGPGGRAVLACFPKSATPAVFLLVLNAEDFEKAAIDRRIVPVTPQPTLPPWLQDSGIRDLTLHYKANAGKAGHADRWGGLVEGAVAALPELLRSGADIEKGINKFGTAAKQNVPRFRFYTLAKYVFGPGNQALLSQRFRSGQFDRQALPPGEKLGRPSSLKGRKYGRRVTPLDVEAILEGYAKHHGLGVNRKTIYLRTMIGLGCKQKPGSRYDVVMPDGSPMLTFEQADYILVKNIGVRQLQIDRFGKERVRNRSDGNQGTYRELSYCIGERVETDVANLKASPTLFDGSVSKHKTNRAILADVGSTLIIGVGFGFATEKAQAYNAALFCAAIDKKLFCSFFGYEIQDGEWPSIGIPPALLKDGGPGRAMNKSKQLSSQIAQAYSGQAKGSAESRHPPEDKIEGKPTFSVTAMRPVQQAVDEIKNVIAYNNHSPRGRTPDMVKAGVPANSLGVYSYLDSVGRNLCRPMSFDAALDFLPKGTGICTADGIIFKNRLWRSKRLFELGLLRKATAGRFEVTVHYLPFCMRHIWLIWGDTSYQLNLTFEIPGAESELYLTLEEIELLARIDSGDRAEAEYLRTVGGIAYEARMIEVFGFDPSSWREEGKPKKSEQTNNAVRAQRKALE